MVFDALLELDERTAVGLRRDLEELAKSVVLHPIYVLWTNHRSMCRVLESFYGVLQEITGPNYASLVSRLVYRNEIASMLAEQDRNLDTTITAFQVSVATFRRFSKFESI